MGLALLAVACIAYVSVPGFVNGKSLGYSVAQNAGGLTYLGSLNNPKCWRPQGSSDDWICQVDDTQGSSFVRYEVATSGACWEGKMLKPSEFHEGDPLAVTVDGCVKIGDNLRLLDRVLDLI